MPCAAPPILFNRWSYAGWLTALVQALPTKLVVGVFYIVGASLWTLESVLSVWVLQLVRGSACQRFAACLRQFDSSIDCTPLSALTMFVCCDWLQGGGQK